MSHHTHLPCIVASRNKGMGPAMMCAEKVSRLLTQGVCSIAAYASIALLALHVASNQTMNKNNMLSGALYREAQGGAWHTSFLMLDDVNLQPLTTGFVLSLSTLH